MNKKLPSVKKNALLNSIRSILSIVFPLITYPYVTRILQADNLGKVNFASSTMSYFSLLAVLGLTNYAGREGIKYRDNQKKLNEFCSELLTLNICTTIFSYIALGGLILIFPSFQPYMGLLGIYSITILFSTFGMEWIYTIYEDYTYITIRSIIFQVASIPLMFVLVRNKNDFYLYAGINVFASVGSNIFNMIHSRKYISPKFIINKKIFQHLKSSLVFFANSIASSIYCNIDTTMLGLMCTDYNVGIYAVSVKIYTMVKSILTAVMAVTLPRLTYYRFNKLYDEFNLMASKLVKTMVTLLIPVVVGINLTAREIILVISGEGYIESIVSLRILSLAIFASIFASITSNILVSCKKEKIVLKGTIMAVITNVGINIVVIPVFQQNGAAFTTVLAELVVFLFGFYNLRMDVRFENLCGIIKSSLAGCLVMIMFAVLIEHISNIVLVRLSAKLIICSITYFGICFMMKNDVVLEYWELVKRKIKQ